MSIFSFDLRASKIRFLVIFGLYIVQSELASPSLMGESYMAFNIGELWMITSGPTVSHSSKFRFLLDFASY